jgi:hypothetical protein
MFPFTAICTDQTSALGSISIVANRIAIIVTRTSTKLRNRIWTNIKREENDSPRSTFTFHLPLPPVFAYEKRHLLHRNSAALNVLRIPDAEQLSVCFLSTKTVLKVIRWRAGRSESEFWRKPVNRVFASCLSIDSQSIIAPVDRVIAVELPTQLAEAVRIRYLSTGTQPPPFIKSTYCCPSCHKNIEQFRIKACFKLNVSAGSPVSICSASSPSTYCWSYVQTVASWVNETKEDEEEKMWPRDDRSQSIERARNKALTGVNPWPRIWGEREREREKRREAINESRLNLVEPIIQKRERASSASIILVVIESAFCFPLWRFRPDSLPRPNAVARIRLHSPPPPLSLYSSPYHLIHVPVIIIVKIVLYRHVHNMFNNREHANDLLFRLIIVRIDRAINEHLLLCSFSLSLCLHQNPTLLSSDSRFLSTERHILLRYIPNTLLPLLSRTFGLINNHHFDRVTSDRWF